MIKKVHQAISAAQAEYLAIPLKSYKGHSVKRRHRNSLVVVSRKLHAALVEAGIDSNKAHSMVFDIEHKFRDGA
jgi:hypothetical protein